MRLLWLKTYAPVTETAVTSSPLAWSAREHGDGDVFDEDGDTNPDGSVPPRSGWAVSSAPPRIAPWTEPAANDREASS